MAPGVDGPFLAPHAVHGARKSLRPARAPEGQGGRLLAHLHQRHLGAEGQEYLLGLGGVRVVTVLVKPLLEGSRHVLQSLALVPHLAAVLPGSGTRGRREERPG